MQAHDFGGPSGPWIHTIRSQAYIYLANTDGRRKLVIAKILHTISVPGKFQVTKL